MTELFVKTGHFFFKEFDYDWLVKDLKNSLPQELDFEIEANNARTMKDLFDKTPEIKVPEVYSSLSTVKKITFFSFLPLLV